MFAAKKHSIDGTDLYPKNKYGMLPCASAILLRVVQAISRALLWALAELRAVVEAIQMKGSEVAAGALMGGLSSHSPASGGMALMTSMSSMANPKKKVGSRGSFKIASSTENRPWDCVLMCFMADVSGAGEL